MYAMVIFYFRNMLFVFSSEDLISCFNVEFIVHQYKFKNYNNFIN